MLADCLPDGVSNNVNGVGFGFAHQACHSSGLNGVKFSFDEGEMLERNL